MDLTLNPSLAGVAPESESHFSGIGSPIGLCRFLYRNCKEYGQIRFFAGITRSRSRIFEESAHLYFARNAVDRGAVVMAAGMGAWN